MVGSAATAVLLTGSTLEEAASSPAVAAPLASAERVVNGSFSDGTTGWRTTGRNQTFTIVSDRGSAVAKLTATSPTLLVLNDRKNTVAAAAAGSTYEVSARVRTTGRS